MISDLAWKGENVAYLSDVIVSETAGLHYLRVTEERLIDLDC